MAPVARNHTTKPHANGKSEHVEPGHDAPSSTLAANLVNNLTNTRKPAKNDEQEDFQQLLLELSENPDGDGLLDDDRRKIEHQHKLIYVVAKAVLTPLSKDGLFSHSEQQLQQGSEALDIITATIKETPEVLIHIAGSGAHLQSGSKVPLWLWLFPQILPLLARRRCVKLRDKVKDLLDRCFHVSQSLPVFWGVTKSMFTFLRYCAEGPIGFIQNSASAADSTINLILPPTGLETELSGIADIDLLREGCTYSLHDVEGAIHHTTQLLYVLSQVVVPNFYVLAVPLFSIHLPWMIDSIRAVNDIRMSRLNQHNENAAICPVLICGYRAIGRIVQRAQNSITFISRKANRLCLELSSQVIDAALDLGLQWPEDMSLLSTVGVVCSRGSADRALVDTLLARLRIWRDTVCTDSEANKIVDRVLQSNTPVTASANIEQCAASVNGNMINGTSVYDRPAKRQKLHETANDRATLDRLFELLNLPSDVTSEDLAKDSRTNFSSLNVAEQSDVFVILQSLACGSRHPDAMLLIDGQQHGEDIRSQSCMLCDGNIYTRDKASKPDTHSSYRTAISIFEELIKDAAFETCQKARIQAMITLRSFLRHYDVPLLCDLEVSSCGQWCLRCLKSSVRELRIAASRTLPLFCLASTDSEMRNRNLHHMIDILQEVSSNCAENLVETCILAWGQLGRVGEIKCLNVVLMKLVEYLGSSNQLVSSIAFNEILRLADALEISVNQLFGPCWRSVGHLAVRDLQNRPQAAQLLADALSISVAQFLVLTQSATLPRLVIEKRRDILNRIAEAQSEASLRDPAQLCLHSTNIAPIMALLLTQNVPDIELHAMDLLKNISSHFNKLDLAEILRTEPIGIALELLKMAGEEDDSKKSRVRYALQYLASAVAPNVAGSQSSKKISSVGPFLEQYVLGIMAHFSDLLNDARGWQTTVEKCRSLKGLEELLRVGRSYIRTALPQICACMQSALGIAELRGCAFNAWATMCKSLDDDDLGTLLENTMSTIVLRWDDFDNATKETAQNLLTYLFAKRKKLLQEYVEVLPRFDSLPELAQHERAITSFRKNLDVRQHFEIFVKRVSHEHSSVVAQALVELTKFLHKHQGWLQTSAISEQPDPVVASLLRAVLEACTRFNPGHPNIAKLSGQCIGLIGCVDPNRVETVRERREYLVISNFEEAIDTTDFVLFLLEEVLVKAFMSATNPRAQGFLSFTMQELLEKCDFRVVCANHRRSGSKGTADELYDKWLALPDSTRAVLTPFLKSRYIITEMQKTVVEYPIYQPDKKYAVWLRSFVMDLLEQPHNANAVLIFAPLCRVVRIQDTSVANSLLPYVILHAVVSGTDEQRAVIEEEIIRVLSYEAAPDLHHERTNVRLCSEALFRVLDYMSRWSQLKQAQLKNHQSRREWAGDVEQKAQDTGIQRVNALLARIPPEIISSRAVECNSYARALFHWEEHIRQTRNLVTKLASAREKAAAKTKDTKMLERLQDIYAEIDEPDGIEGISAHLNLDIDQQILGHRKNGRWAAAQSWYEIKLAEHPDDVDIQVNLLQCLKESGQHDVLLNYVDGMHKTSSSMPRLLPFTVEASWTTWRWDVLRESLITSSDNIGGDFNVNVSRALVTLHDGDHDKFERTISALREHVAGSLSATATSSWASCHEIMVKLHVLTELQMIAKPRDDNNERQQLIESLDRRLEVVGSYSSDKQYILGLRRAAMALSPGFFRRTDIAESWLTSAKLARKANLIPQSFNAVLHASQLGDASATIEHARLLWKGGSARQAIQSLESAIANNAFIYHNHASDIPTDLTAGESNDQQNLLTARAHLLLAKWLDSAGQTHAAALRQQYQLAAKSHQSWEKGHYYLGRHYNKLLEAEKGLAFEHQSTSFLSGETARLVVENYLRSWNYGTKYVFQTLPRVLTLWLDLGMQVHLPIDTKTGGKELAIQLAEKRKDQLKQMHAKLAKYVQKTPAYIFYTALPQIVARIAHPNGDVYKYISQIIMKVVSSHPQQALWTLFAVSISTQQDRKTRGTAILQGLRSSSRKSDVSGYDTKALIAKGEKLANELLMVCNAGDFQGNRNITASITKDLGFNHKLCTPNPLVVPVEATLTATLPTLTDNVRGHKAFARDIVTVTSFEDKVLVLSSLQKPRKLTARGSNGQLYGLMCKPKDDLRKDQRLMEFNSMINRSLKRDAESSKRQLYIKTYAVTPLNEECGIIEWVDGLKTLRDILLTLYKARGIFPNYGEIKMQLDEACKGEDKLPWFTDKVLGTFPPVFHYWFVSQFPDPSAWFTARLKYTRSCAVMSMVGTILGLGDRHGENILFEEGNGGTFHVDFNCLFDKGLTFAQPERVPFRLTHNMVDAMGVYGYEGPFRKSCELTLTLLRQHEDTLMTILEAFVYDPTLDLIAKKNKIRKNVDRDREMPPDTAQGVLDAIRRKVRGLLAGESVPLGVEGQVDELIKQAVSPKNLAAMYIGWCAFF